MNSKNNSACAEKSYIEIAEKLKAAGHPVRLRILHELAMRSSCCCGEMCDCFPHSQSTISQHLSVLKDAGLVSAETEGTKSRFSINLGALNALQSELDVLLKSTHGCCDE